MRNAFTVLNQLQGTSQIPSDGSKSDITDLEPQDFRNHDMFAADLIIESHSLLGMWNMD